MPTADINGIPLHYESSGAGPTVVLIMGTGASGRAWHLHQVPALVDAGFHVVTFDNRGIPPTGRTEGFTLDDMAADTAGLMEHLDQGRCHVVGVSLGAHVAQELALARPDLVESLVCLATRGRADRTRAAAAAAERELWDSGIRLPPAYRAVQKALQNLSPRTLADDQQAADWLDVLEMTDTAGPGVRTQLDLGDIDRLSAYRGISVPCRVIAFADDRVSPPHLGREVADTVPHADFHVVADCGHYGYLERPEAVNELVLDFIAGPDRPGTRPQGSRTAGTPQPSSEMAEADV